MGDRGGCWILRYLSICISCMGPVSFCAVDRYRYFDDQGNPTGPARLPHRTERDALYLLREGRSGTKLIVEVSTRLIPVALASCQTCTHFSTSPHPKDFPKRSAIPNLQATPRHLHILSTLCPRGHALLPLTFLFLHIMRIDIF